VKPKLRRYAIAVDATGRPAHEEGGALTWDGAWTPEHLLLAALARCSLIALEYHARRESLEVEATAAASGVVGPRDDGAWGFLQIECRIEASFPPDADPARFRPLAARAERGCFIGQSLTPKPRYHWTINGEEIS
jgi:organic hydroperoxide reductase OsmC/OhrA